MRKIGEEVDLTTKAKKDKLESEAREGDTYALTDLLIIYRPRLEGLAYKFCTDTSIAEDLVSEAYERAWKFYPKFRGDSLIWTWLFRIVLNVCYNHSLSRKRKVLVNGVDRNTHEYNEENLNQSHFRPSAGDPRDDAEATQTRDLIENAYNKLSEDHQEVLRLYEAEGLSYSDIADKVVAPIGTVKSRIYTARNKLANVLEDFER